MKKIVLIIIAVFFTISNTLTAQVVTYDFTTLSNWGGNSFYDFGNVPLQSTSAESYFTASGAGFNPTIGPPMVVNAPADFKISLTSGGPYTSQVTIPIAGGMFPNTTIYVVCEPTILGFVGGYIEFRRDISSYVDNTAYPYGTGTTALVPVMDITGLNGNPVPNGSTQPNGQNGTWFGTTTSGGSLTRTFTINNTGIVNLNLTDLGGGNYVDIIGRDPDKFSVIQQPTTPITPSGSTTFILQFGPETVAETYEATVSIGNNDPDDNPYTFAIGARIQASLPTLTGPTTAYDIDYDEATSGGNVTSDGGATVTDRNVCYTLTSNGWDPTTADFRSNDGGTGTGTYSATMISSLQPETQYDYRAYATNEIGTVYSPASDAPSFWTLSILPASHPASFTAEAFSGTQINLTFSSPSSITYCDGYLILMKQGSYPDATLVADGTAYTIDTDLGSGTIVKDIITNTATTTSQITGLSPGVTYYFAIIPYNWNGTITPTYNYHNVNPKTDFTTTSPTTSTWNGNGSWNTPTNWSNGVPGATTNAIIASSNPTAPLLVDLDAQCNNLTVQQGAYVSIVLGRTLTVNGNLVIESNASGNGSLIAGGTAGNINVTGTTTVNQFLTGAKQYQVSPPVDGVTFATLQASPNSDNDFFRWRENNSMWIDCNLKPPTQDLREGYGYHVLYNLASGNNVTKSYSGSLISINLSPAVTNSSGAHPDWKGWNLVGNPYPCAIDWDLGNWTKQNIWGTIYIYNGTTYLYWDGVNQVGNIAGGVIPSMQGFYIWADSIGPAVLSIPTDARVHSSQSNYKNTNTKDDLLKLSVEGNNLIDETFIYFSETATEEFDANFDAYKLPGKYLPPTPGWEVEAPQLYSIVPGDMLSINVLPYDEDHTIVHLGFEPKDETTYKISASEFESFESKTKLYLEDLKERKLINLRENANYEFTGSPTDPIERFLVHFSQTEVTLTQHNFNEVDIWSNNKTIFIDNTNNYQGEVVIYNVMGQKVYHGTLEGSVNTIGMTSQSGYYIVRVITDQNLQTVKVFIK